MKAFLFSLSFLVIFSSCSKSIDYTSEHIKQTSGRYLYHQDELIEVYYENNTLFLKFKGAENIKPVALDENTFFVDQIYKKLRFVKHPETGKRYLSVLNEANEHAITYDYLKVNDTFKTPSMYLKNKQYDEALIGFLELQEQDSTSTYITENYFNSLGYEFLRKRAYTDAIGVFKINVALYPESDNVYDSLGEAYLKQGDSLEAFNNYNKALELNTSNRRAQQYVEAYTKE